MVYLTAVLSDVFFKIGQYLAKWFSYVTLMGPNVSWNEGQNDPKMDFYTKIRIQKEDSPNEKKKSLSCSSYSQMMMFSIYTSGSSYHSPSIESGSSYK